MSVAPESAHTDPVAKLLTRCFSQGERLGNPLTTRRGPNSQTFRKRSGEKIMDPDVMSIPGFFEVNVRYPVWTCRHPKNFRLNFKDISLDNFI